MLLVIIAGVVAGISSLIVALILVARDSWSKHLAIFGTPLAAGILLMTVRDLIPHAINEGVSASNVITATIIGIVTFFLIEKVSQGFHHHHDEDLSKEYIKDTKDKKIQGWLFLIGDSFHNLVDGIALGGAFLVSPATGIVAAIAITAHELPQEVGEFSMQVRAGFSKKQTIIRNIIASFTTLFGAVFIYQFGADLNLPLGYIYGGIAGFFLYISLSDIIPTIHMTEKSRIGLQTTMLFVGMSIGLVVGSLAHDYIDRSNVDNGHGHEEKAK